MSVYKIPLELKHR